MNKILVIEDEPEMRRNLLTILRFEKFVTLGAENGRQGLELARRERPISSLRRMMPELDGTGCWPPCEIRHGADALHLSHRQGRETDVRAGMNLGADDYLTAGGQGRPADRHPFAPQAPGAAGHPSVPAQLRVPASSSNRRLG
jgi:DNA-binding response OmpR family regulator